MPYALLGFSLGLSAGLAPGPLLALVIQRSLHGGLTSGLRVALAPLITDLPIVILALLLVGRLPRAPSTSCWASAVCSCCGWASTPSVMPGRRSPWQRRPPPVRTCGRGRW